MRADTILLPARFQMAMMLIGTGGDGDAAPELQKHEMTSFRADIEKRDAYR